MCSTYIWFHSAYFINLQLPEDENHRAWGNQRNMFYDGNDGSESDGGDNLEQEEINLAETRLSGVLKENDYEPYWLETNEVSVSESPLHLLLYCCLFSIANLQTSCDFIL